MPRGCFCVRRPALRVSAIPRIAWVSIAFVPLTGSPDQAGADRRLRFVYGHWFQEQAVPDVDRRSDHPDIPNAKGFHIRTFDGEESTRGRVVVATGISLSHRPAHSPICRTRSSPIRSTTPI